MRKSLTLVLTGLLTVAALTGCTSGDNPDKSPNTAAPLPAPTVTVTVTPPTTTVSKPAPTVTVTAPAPGGTTSIISQLLPTDTDIANLSYRSGMPADTFTQFTVPASGYELLYICYGSKLGDATDAVGYADSNEGGSHNSAKLTCNSKIHTLKADAAYVKKVGAVGKLTKLTITGDRMFVLGVDMSVRPLGVR